MADKKDPRDYGLGQVFKVTSIPRIVKKLGENSPQILALRQLAADAVRLNAPELSERAIVALEAFDASSDASVDGPGPCPRCQCKTLFEIEVDVEDSRLRGGKGVGLYIGCPACPWASPMLNRAVVKRDAKSRKEADGERLECEECGESFNVNDSGSETRCVKCAGFDVVIDRDPEHKP